MLECIIGHKHRKDLITCLRKITETTCSGVIASEKLHFQNALSSL